MDIIIILIIFLIASAVLYYILYRNYERVESPIIVISTVISFAITISFILILGKSFKIHTGIGNLDMDTTGQVGDFIGGTVGTIMTAISIILLYKTLNEQRKNSEDQSKQFIKSQIENRFFELLKYHRDNVTTIEYDYFENLKKIKKTKGHQFFVIVNTQLQLAFDEFDKYIKKNDLKVDNIYEEPYLNKISLNKTIIDREINDKFLLAKIDICYLVVFIGVSKNGRLEIQEITKDKYKQDFISDVLTYFKFKPCKSSRFYPLWESIIKKEYLREGTSHNELFKVYPSDRYIKYYGGHKFRLGHYFRHLYQIVCYLHYNEELKDQKDKLNYTRVLRGQLSDYEQILFFYNSISQMGRVWELADSKNNTIDSNNHLITNYKLIKSVSNSVLVDGIKPSSFYPIKNNNEI